MTDHNIAAIDSGTEFEYAGEKGTDHDRLTVVETSSDDESVCVEFAGEDDWDCMSFHAFDVMLSNGWREVA